jgi:hypothetical protein
MDYIPEQWRVLRLEFTDVYIQNHKNYTKLQSCNFDCGYIGIYEDMDNHHKKCKLNEINNTNHTNTTNLNTKNLNVKCCIL